MFKLSVSAELFASFPDYRAIVVYAKNLVNQQEVPEAISLLRAVEDHARQRLSVEGLSAHPHIAAWRSAYASFGAKPSKFLCSAEALLKRTLKRERSAVNQSACRSLQCDQHQICAAGRGRGLG